MEKLDVKQKVLLALYTEYQKNLPNMNSIKPETLEMEPDVFYVALMKLENEGYVTDLTEIRWAGHRYPAYRLDDAKLTLYGIEFIESKLEIDPTATSEEKAKGVIGKVGEWGMDQLKDIIAKVAAELIKG